MSYFYYLGIALYSGVTDTNAIPAFDYLIAAKQNTQLRLDIFIEQKVF